MEISESDLPSPRGTSTPLPPPEEPSVPEMVYQVNDGLPTGTSTVGFRSATMSSREASELSEQRLNLSDSDVGRAQQDRGDTLNVLVESSARSRQNAANISERLQERLRDTNFWKEALEREIDDMLALVARFLVRRQELNMLLMLVEDAIIICTDNINAREQRYGEDSQQDDVATQLLRELNVLNNAANLLKQAIQTCDLQITKNRFIKEQIEKIWSDKMEASELLQQAGDLNEFSTNMQFFPGEARRHPQAAQSTVESWAQHSHDVVLRSQNERMASEQHLTLTRNLINDIGTEITQQKDVVNESLQTNLTTLEADLARYRERLMNVNSEICENEHAINDLRDAISDKNNFLKLVQTRLHMHNRRPGVENTRDPPQQAMLDELRELEETLERLNAHMVNHENHLQRLQDTQYMLEKQILSKQHTIQIERDHVVRHRANYPSFVTLPTLS